jgi:cytochrome P450
MSNIYLSGHSLITVVGDLYGAGSGTTSITLTWSILYLMTFPKVQAKLQEELDSVVGKSRAPCLADRPK